VVLPSAASATHVGCGDVITEDTTLDSDLVNCPEDGVVIGASGITLDLAGHLIDGISTPGAAGADNSGGHDGVTVTGGTIREFGFSAHYVDAQGGNVTQLDVRPLIFLFNSSDIRIEKNTTGSIELFPSSDHVVISRNRVGGAVLAFQAPDLVIDRNTITGVSGIGIELSLAPRSLIARNTITITEGNLLSHVAGIAVSNNPAGQPTLVERNEVSGSTTGIRLASANDIVLTRNTAFENTVDGVFATNSPNVLIDGNRAERNGDDGIDLDSVPGTISGNTANFNGDLGIEAVPGVTDGGGNKARGNGDPAQCENVSCR
jgi:parallel beta-helix repeat protein